MSGEVSPCNRHGALHVPVDEEIHLLDCNIGMVILAYSRPRIVIKNELLNEQRFSILRPRHGKVNMQRNVKTFCNVYMTCSDP
jgi:hypothetical protein